MNKPMIAFFLVLLSTSATARAASQQHEHLHDTLSQSAQQTAAPHSGTGVLKAINAKAGKVLIAHEPIAVLGWPSMTMWFALRVPLPDETMVGIVVRFELEQINSKEWVITRIERKK